MIRVSDMDDERKRLARGRQQVAHMYLFNRDICPLGQLCQKRRDAAAENTKFLYRKRNEACVGATRNRSEYFSSLVFSAWLTVASGDGGI
jgi:hypothetical protein